MLHWVNLLDGRSMSSIVFCPMLAYFARASALIWRTEKGVLCFLSLSNHWTSHCLQTLQKNRWLCITERQVAMHNSLYVHFAYRLLPCPACSSPKPLYWLSSVLGVLAFHYREYTALVGHRAFCYAALDWSSLRTHVLLLFFDVSQHLWELLNT